MSTSLDFVMLPDLFSASAEWAHIGLRDIFLVLLHVCLENNKYTTKFMFNFSSFRCQQIRAVATMTVGIDAVTHGKRL